MLVIVYRFIFPHLSSEDLAISISAIDNFCSLLYGRLLPVQELRCQYVHGLIEESNTHRCVWLEVSVLPWGMEWNGPICLEVEQGLRGESRAFLSHNRWVEKNHICIFKCNCIRVSYGSRGSWRWAWATLWRPSPMSKAKRFKWIFCCCW